MANQTQPDLGEASLRFLQQAAVAIVRDDARSFRDLTLRQLSVFLMVYLEDEPATLARLAARLLVPKPSVLRAVDRLQEQNLVRRVFSAADRRKMVIAGTAGGEKYKRQLARFVLSADPSPRRTAAAGAATERAKVAPALPVERPAQAA